MTHFLVTGVSGLLGLNFALAVDGKKHQVTGVANTTPMLWATFKNVQAELTGLTITGGHVPAEVVGAQPVGDRGPDAGTVGVHGGHDVVGGRQPGE